MTIFGCASGGMPQCGEDGNNDLECANEDIGTVGIAEILRAQVRDQCVCGEASRAPICSESQEQPLCPDGTQPDLTIEGVARFLRNCN